MTHLEWVCVVLIVSLLVGLCWMADTGWPQAAPAGGLEERLERIEEQLDQLLEREGAADKPADKPEPKRRLRPPRRLRQVPPPPAGPAEPLFPLPRMDPSPLPDTVEALPARREWTWGEVDRWRGFHAMTRGD